MNVYEITPGIEVGDCFNCFWHVIAETRSKAWKAFIDYWEAGIEWTAPKSIKTLARDVSYPEGVDDNFQWARDTGYKMTFHEDVETD